ncbi:actin-like protein 2, putative [Trypanosoma brucei gambiense DAL972]|uniref:Actin-like protein 2, putative n=2 Tax=Trypanosoma brucei gambiense (strain MHOM/CI/86/DAL972) TaxID=679716 RepID=D0A0S3_TRYB9|nr:actin-like protein 2, putative [Trypanosoma brucei gambiense DAL972]CBH16831.1 actin-like protein 2, putative [Trypanosoma brucei gambiense DAL972]|eukprot:XP_011779095.1 actin-like protein 2, putative [Trypanosoma brucei gambiense DAL972]
MSEKLPVVLDNGSGFLKCGFAGSNFPEVFFRTAVGRPVLRQTKMSEGRSSKRKDTQVDPLTKDLVLGDECNGAHHLLDMTFPIHNGVIQNMDDMRYLWKHAFHNLLSVEPEDHSLLISEAPLFSHKDRVKLYEVMFEEFKFPFVQSTPQGVLSLFSNGLQTGVAVECGECVSHCTPIFEGYTIPKANRRVDLGGRNITEFLVRLMQRRGYSFNQSSDFETVRCIKERFCYAAVDPKLEQRLALETTVLEKTFLLPDGSSCSIGQERFEATEALFQPRLIDVECEGISSQLWNCIQATDIDVRSALYSHVVLSGGSTMFPGFPSRIERDMRAAYSERIVKGDPERLSRFPLCVEDPPRRRWMSFLGGAALAAVTAGNHDMWLSKKEWDEGGASAIQARFGV